MRFSFNPKNSFVDLSRHLSLRGVLSTHQGGRPSPPELMLKYETVPTDSLSGTFSVNKFRDNQPSFDASISIPLDWSCYKRYRTPGILVHLDGDLDATHGFNDLPHLNSFKGSITARFGLPYTDNFHAQAGLSLKPTPTWDTVSPSWATKSIKGSIDLQVLKPTLRAEKVQIMEQERITPSPGFFHLDIPNAWDHWAMFLPPASAAILTQLGWGPYMTSVVLIILVTHVFWMVNDRRFAKEEVKEATESFSNLNYAIRSKQYIPRFYDWFWLGISRKSYLRTVRQQALDNLWQDNMLTHANNLPNSMQVFNITEKAWVDTFTSIYTAKKQAYMSQWLKTRTSIKNFEKKIFGYYSFQFFLSLSWQWGAYTVIFFIVRLVLSLPFMLLRIEVQWVAPQDLINHQVITPYTNITYVKNILSLCMSVFFNLVLVSALSDRLQQYASDILKFILTTLKGKERGEKWHNMLLVDAYRELTEKNSEKEEHLLQSSMETCFVPIFRNHLISRQKIDMTLYKVYTGHYQSCELYYIPRDCSFNYFVDKYYNTASYLEYLEEDSFLSGFLLCLEISTSDE